jgi:hypothetical protein
LTTTLWYVATPYSKYPGGIEEAYKLACRCAAKLILAGIPCISPIAHSHGIAEYGRIDPREHKIWMPADHAIMRVCTGLIVVMAEGWAESFGVREEIRTFDAAGKPIVRWDPQQEPPLRDLIVAAYYEKTLTPEAWAVAENRLLGGADN